MSELKPCPFCGSVDDVTTAASRQGVLHFVRGTCVAAVRAWNAFPRAADQPAEPIERPCAKCGGTGGVSNNARAEYQCSHTCPDCDGSGTIAAAPAKPEGAAALLGWALANGWEFIAGAAYVLMMRRPGTELPVFTVRFLGTWHELDNLGDEARAAIREHREEVNHG